MHKRLIPSGLNVALMALLAIGGLGRLSAQVSTATITGNVTDASGAAVPEAAIQVKNLGTGVTQNSVSDAQGRFTAASLGIGEYSVQASKSGFQTVVHTGITLTVGAQTVVDFSLPVGQAQQTVTVQGEVAQVETTNATVANLVEQTQMRELPLNGRNFQQLILLSPGVSVGQIVQQSFYGKGETYSISGGRPEGQLYLLDGTDIANFFNHGTGASVLGTSLGIDAIAEFQTLTNTYGAQFGGHGSVINAASKSGTNAFHGSAFEFLRNSALDTRNQFDKANEAPPFRRNQFGGTIGGPVKKDKAFFFFNYEGLRQSKTYSNVANVPDANGRKGIIAGQQLALSPITAPYLNLWPSTDLINPNGSGIITIPVPASQVGDENYYLGRFDYNIGSKDSMMARVVRDGGTLKNPFPYTTIPLWPDVEPSTNTFATIEERHIFSPTLINVARASFVRTVNSSRTQNSVGGLMQFTPGQGRQDGQLQVTGLSFLGAQALEPYDVIQNKFTESDEMIWTKGAHTFKFGAAITRQQTYEYQPFRASGLFIYNSFREFLTNTQPSGLAGPFNYQGAPPGNNDAARAWRETFFMPYFNDDWKVSPKLTINVGLRYDFDTNPKDVMGNTLNIVCPPRSCAGTISTGFTYTQNVFAQNPSTHNWQPRFGFAYDPFKDHKTSIRGGFGLFDNVIQPRAWSSGFVTGPPFITILAFNTAATPVSFPNPFASASFAAPKITQGQSMDYLTKNTPYLMEWNLNLQRELMGGSILTVGYVGSRGVHLMSQHDLNPPKATIDSNGVYHFGANGVANARVSPDFAALNNAVAYGNSWYNSMQANLSKRFSKNWQGQVVYTWSHSIDLGSGTTGLETGGGGQGNPYLAAYERGNSSFDVRHAFRANSVYVLPFKANQLVSGWQLSGIFSWTGGLPILVNPGFDRALTSNTASGTERPNLNPGWTADSMMTGNPNQWFNPAAFSLQDSGTLGNFGRNVIRNPGLVDVDFAIMKDTKITKISEQFAIQFRAELFNIFNHTNYAPMGTAVGTGGTLGVFTSSGAVNSIAGQLTSTATDSRQVQFGLKVTF